MNLTLNQKSARKGFTLIEMIGVLAVIAILASLLIPKIYEAINNSRISNTVLSYNTVKTALADHYAKFGALLSSNGTAYAVGAPGMAAFDKTLVAEGFLDKPFQVKIGDTTTHVEVIAGAGAVPVTTANDGTYDLDGNGSVNDAQGTAVVQAVIGGVTGGDALALSTLLDGTSLSSTNGAASADSLGRVKYAAPGAGGTTTVYIYVTHR